MEMFHAHKLTSTHWTLNVCINLSFYGRCTEALLFLYKINIQIEIRLKFQNVMSKFNWKLFHETSRIQANTISFFIRHGNVEFTSYCDAFLDCAVRRQVFGCVCLFVCYLLICIDFLFCSKFEHVVHMANQLCVCYFEISNSVRALDT